MKTINKYLLLLASAVFTFTACEKEIERDPSPVFEGSNSVFFLVSSESEEMEPTAALQHEIKIARDSASSAAITVKLIVAENTENVFEVPESITFGEGVFETSFVVKFPKAQGGDYALSLELESQFSNPYTTLKPIYSYKVNVIKFEDGAGVWIDDAVIASTFGVDPATGWHVNYQIAELPSGLMKVRILNPYTNMASGQDENGLFDGCPWNDPGDWDESQDYHISLIVDPASKQVTLENKQTDLGVLWGDYGMMFLYDNKSAIGLYEAEAGKITFFASNQTMVFGMGEDLYSYAGFRFYLSLDAYIAEQSAVEPIQPVNADVESYVGNWNLKLINFRTGEEAVQAISVASEEDEQGQYYVINGIHGDAPQIYGGFDEELHVFILSASLGVQVEDEGKTYQAYWYPLTEGGQLKTALALALNEDGTLGLHETTAAQGFAILYENVEDENDYSFGDAFLIAGAEPATEESGEGEGSEVAPRRMNAKSNKAFKNHAFKTLR